MTVSQARRFTPAGFSLRPHNEARHVFAGCYWDREGSCKWSTVYRTVTMIAKFIAHKTIKLQKLCVL
jgi:hypothetical protein